MQLLPWFWHLIHRLSTMLASMRLKVLVRLRGEAPRGAALICAKHASAFDIPILADQCWRLRRDRPYFQMGSFVGYAVLGRLVPFMRRLGGFCVMRPKEVLRLRRKQGWSRERVHRRMEEVNGAAERVRAEVLRREGTLVVFPEGTRDDSRVLPLASELELRTALAVEKEGGAVAVWPVVLSYGRPGRLRRSLIVDFLPPFPLKAREPAGVLGLVAERFESSWLPPAEVDAVVREHRGPSGVGRPVRT